VLAISQCDISKSQYGLIDEHGGTWVPIACVCMNVSRGFDAVVRDWCHASSMASGDGRTRASWLECRHDNAGCLEDASVPVAAEYVGRTPLVLANMRDMGTSDAGRLEDVNVPVTAKYVGWTPLVLANMRDVGADSPCTECWVLVPRECGCGT
jgi:predicted protein tyrosine phosphatase